MTLDQVDLTIHDGFMPDRLESSSAFRAARPNTIESFVAHQTKVAQSLLQLLHDARTGAITIRAALERVENYKTHIIKFANTDEKKLSIKPMIDFCNNVAHELHKRMS